MKKQLLLLVMMLLPMMAMAVEVEIGELWYELVSKTKEAQVIQYKNNIKYTGNIVIPESVEYNGESYSVKGIGTSAFLGCSITSVIIPNSVTSLENGAFSYCFELNAVTIPNSVTSIGKEAFYKCTKLTTFTIPNSVTSIEQSTFSYCSNLTSVTIPNSLTSIGKGAFLYCDKLTSVHISDLEAWFSITFNNYYSNPLYYAHHLFLNGEEIKNLVIPDGVTSIANRAFVNCTGITSVKVSRSVTSIGEYAFYNCSNLVSATIGEGVTNIKGDAFNGCKSLTSITFSDNLTNIDGNAFEGCSALSSIIIPNSVTRIYISAFRDCSGLISVSIGNGIKALFGNAFGNCPDLSDVYCYAEDVPYTETNAFEGSLIDYATLHVPDASIDLYKAAEPWKNFKTIIGLDGTPPVEPEKCATPTIQIVGGKLKLSCETEGVTFVTSYTSDGLSDSTLDDEIVLAGTTTCHVSVYATKEGYEDSDVATADVELHIGKKGDVNADGEVNVGDIVTTTNIMAGKDE